MVLTRLGFDLYEVSEVQLCLKAKVNNKNNIWYLYVFENYQQNFCWKISFLYKKKYVKNGRFKKGLKPSN